MLDCFSRYVWGRLYTSKLPVTAVQALNMDFSTLLKNKVLLAAIQAYRALS